MRYRQLLVTHLLLPWAGACSDSTQPLNSTSPITARVNGQAWASTTPRGDTIARVPVTLDTLDMLGLDSTGISDFTVIHIRIRQLAGIGVYKLGFLDAAEAFYNVYTRTGSLQYVTTSIDTGVVSVDTLDMQTHRLSGTFHFVAAVPSTMPEQTVAITNGHFAGLFEIK